MQQPQLGSYNSCLQGRPSLFEGCTLRLEPRIFGEVGLSFKDSNTSPALSTIKCEAKVTPTVIWHDRRRHKRCLQPSSDQSAIGGRSGGKCSIQEMIQIGISKRKKDSPKGEYVVKMKV